MIFFTVLIAKMPEMILADPAGTAGGPKQSAAPIMRYPTITWRTLRRSSVAARVIRLFTYHFLIAVRREKEAESISMNPQKAIIVIIATLSASLALADDFKTINGKEYKDATVTRVEPDGIMVKTKSGITKLYFAELPKEVQQRFNYDPQNAAAYGNAQATSIQQTNQQTEESNKRAEVEKQKVEAEKRKALEVSQPAQSAEGVSQQNTENGPHIVGVGGVNGLTVEMGDKHLQLQP